VRYLKTKVPSFPTTLTSSKWPPILSTAGPSLCSRQPCIHMRMGIRVHTRLIELAYIRQLPVFPSLLSR
jgi:hypothetical protein